MVTRPWAVSRSVRGTEVPCAERAGPLSVGLAKDEKHIGKKQKEQREPESSLSFIFLTTQ